MTGVNVSGQMLSSAPTLQTPEPFRESMQPSVNAQGTHTAKYELYTHHPEKPGPFPKGSEDRPHMHGNSVCASLPSGAGALQE